MSRAYRESKLISNGATQFLVPNLLPLGAILRFNTTPYSVSLTQESGIYNGALAKVLDIVRFANIGKHLRIYTMSSHFLAISLRRHLHTK